MKKIKLFFLFFLSAVSLTAQQKSLNYDACIKQADSLYRVKDYRNSAFAFSKAFKVHNPKITINHRYNAACSWALANYPDSAFYYLNFLARFQEYSNYGLIKADPDLKSLNNDSRWRLLLETVLVNRNKMYPNLEMLAVNGFNIEVVTYGLKNISRERPVIVFENGRGTSFEYWLPVIQEVSKENAVFAYNRPRIGSSEDDNQIPTIEHIAKLLHQTLLEKGIKPPYLLVGHSWGAAYIRYFATLYADQVAGLIFVDPHDFVKNEGGGKLPYREIGLSERQIDSIYKSYDNYADEYIAQGPKFVIEEMKAQREFGKNGYDLCNSIPLPDVPVHFIKAGGYPKNSEPPTIYDREKMFRINNNIQIKTWIGLLNNLKYGKFFYSSSSGHNIQTDDPEIIISSIKLALSDYAKINKISRDSF